MFVLDFVPKNYLKGAEEKSVVVFTAGWAMKFVPLLGRALREMALTGASKYALAEFSMTRKGPKPGQTIIIDPKADAKAVKRNDSASQGQAKGSSIRSSKSRV